jgi:hypothetical protein
MKRGHVLLCLGAIVGLTAAPRLLHAQAADAPNIAGGDNMPWNRGVTEDTRAAAREAFLEGNRLFKIPLFSRAVEKYKDALHGWKHPAFYFNLALAEINLGRYLDARENLELAMKHGAEPLRADRFDEAKKQLAEVQSHLGRIRVSCPTSGAEVTLDGVTLFTGPGDREIWVTARTHQITARKSEYGTQAKRVTVAPGARETVALSLRKLIEDRPWATWKPWTVVGAGAGIAVAGGVLHALSAREFDRYDTGFLQLSCAMKGCTEQQIEEMAPGLSARLRRARLEQKVAVGGYVVGGAALAAGAVLLYLNRPHLMEREDMDPDGKGIALVPVISSDMLGVLVTVDR